MTCSEARQYIFAFLDNELDSALSLEVQQHIERCPVCARECEIEQVVRKRLAYTLQEAGPVPVFEEPALAGLIRPVPPSRVRHERTVPLIWRRAAVSATAAALLLAVMFFVANRRSASDRNSFVDALVDDFDHFVTEGKPLQIVSADANEVSEWLFGRTEIAMDVPRVDPVAGTLMGGRKCKINGEPAAFAVYRLGDKLASVVAVRASDESLARMKPMNRNGQTHWVDHCRGHAILAWRRGALTYAVVSRLPEERLSSLLQPGDG